MADRLQSMSLFIKKQTRQIIDLLATDESRYSAVSLTHTCLNNAFLPGHLVSLDEYAESIQLQLDKRFALPELLNPVE